MTILGPHYWEDQRLSEELDAERKARMTAPVSPIATQETPTPGPWQLSPDGMTIFGPAPAHHVVASVRSNSLPLTRMRANGRLIVDAVNALSSAERRIEEKERKLVGADVEWLEMRERARAAESRLASLTRQVEDIVKAAKALAGVLAYVPDDTADIALVNVPCRLLRELRAAIRSLPVLPTTESDDV